MGGLHAEVDLRDGSRTTALVLQRWYHQRIRAWLAASGTVSMGGSLDDQLDSFAPNPFTQGAITERSGPHGNPFAKPKPAPPAPPAAPAAPAAAEGPPPPDDQLEVWSDGDEAPPVTEMTAEGGGSWNLSAAASLPRGHAI